MPCFKREKSLYTDRRREKANERDPLAPKPVRTRAIKYHGMFGMSMVAQHLVSDENWTPSSLEGQLAGMTELLKRRTTYKWHEITANRNRLQLQSRRLKIQCTDGRIKLQKISTGNNAHAIRNFLIKHRDMQRLYQRMPIHLVEDNINQRTFTMRKERDRLQFRLNQLKHHYKTLLVECSEVENLIKYENEFVLQEEIISRILLKKIENSDVRMKAIRTINTTYKKMVQVLMQDEIFYEPILRSLSDDMDDQANFIKYILYLGMPAISKFRDINREFRSLEEKSRRTLHEKMQILASLKALAPAPTGHQQTVQGKNKEYPSADPRHYVRETRSMTALKLQLQSIEKTIKELKLVTICSQAREIYPNVKSQVESNVILDRRIHHDRQNFEMLHTKMNFATVLEGVLINNLSEEEIKRLERIETLKKKLQTETEYEEEILEYLKNRADMIVLFRLRLWNLCDVLRHVDENPRATRTQYPNSYLKLPLLMFEMLVMQSTAPDPYEENIEKVMRALKMKVVRLMKGYRPDMMSQITMSKEKYHQEYLVTTDRLDYFDENDQQGNALDEDLLQANKINANVPNRKQIKAQSAKLLESAAKRELS